MATFNELALLIAEPLKRTLDVSFREQLKERIRYWRARLVKNSLDKKPTDRKFFTQTITIPMEEVEAAQCGIDLNCKVMRSTVDIPQPIRANSILFDFVGSVEGSNPFKMLKKWEMYYALKDKYAPKVTIYATWENKRIIIPHNPLTTYITIDYIAEDPEAAAAINCASTSENCSFDDEEYPIPGDIAQLIVQSILDIDFRRKETKDEEVKVGERPEK